MRYIIALIILTGCVTAAVHMWPHGSPQCHSTHELRGYHDKAALAQARGISEPWNYELDHYIPLCLGGSDDEDNLQFQPWQEALRKDAYEAEICRHVCSGDLTQSEAIHELKSLWPKL